MVFMYTNCLYFFTIKKQIQLIGRQRERTSTQTSADLQSIVVLGTMRDVCVFYSITSKLLKIPSNIKYNFFYIILVYLLLML